MAGIRVSLLAAHDLGEALFERMGRHLQEKGRTLRAGTIMDATIIDAPSSTQNQEGGCDLEMWSTRKGNHWRVRIKAHIGADSRKKRIHSAAATAPNVHDNQVLGDFRMAGSLGSGGIRPTRARAWG